jgi:hypothetical protein
MQVNEDRSLRDKACGTTVRQDSELMSQTLLAATRDQPQLVSSEKLLELSHLVETYGKISLKEPRRRMEKKNCRNQSGGEKNRQHHNRNNLHGRQ